MSYDLAVWEGDRPANDSAARSEFQRLYDLHMGSDVPREPTTRIAAYVAALLAWHPDLSTEAEAEAGDEAADEGSPWSTGPLIGEARGPLLYFPMVWSRCEETSEWAARLAEEHGLNCYDPQWNRLRTPFRESRGFTLTSAGGRSFQDPDVDLIRRVLVHLSRENHYAVLTRADDWYLQVGYGEQAGTRAGWYALERQDGTLDQHFRAEVTNVEDVVQAFVRFAEGDPTVAVRFSWRSYGV